MTDNISLTAVFPAPWSLIPRGKTKLRADIVDANGVELGQVYLNDEGKRAANPARVAAASPMIAAPALGDLHAALSTYLRSRK